MIESIIILLLPLAAWSGWRVAMKKEARALRENKARASYFEGLNFLLNDQSDRALDTFLKLPALDQQAVDIQLILGSLLRKRGELDRALHLHRQLYEQAHLDLAQRRQLIYELAEDYDQAGMYVQAEELYETLLPTDHRREEVKVALARIYERMAQWQKAIDLAVAPPASLAHYYCCLAEERPAETLALLRQALAMDYGCQRAHWLRADYLLRQENHLDSLSAFQGLVELNPSLLPELLEPLGRCYEALQREEEFRRWLLAQEAQQQSPRLTLALLPLLPAETAAALLAERFAARASPFLLGAVLGDQPQWAAVAAKIQPQTSFRCDECGFRHRGRRWHCPACNAWSSFRPLFEIKLSQ